MPSRQSGFRRAAGITRPPGSKNDVAVSRLDATISRLSAIASGVCPDCVGPEHDDHKPSGYSIQGMMAYCKDRPDHAVGLFALTRGAAVVMIDGFDSSCFWWPTRQAGHDHYDGLWRGFCTSQPPGV